jgi:hypothetical protein
VQASEVHGIGDLLALDAQARAAATAIAEKLTI